MALSMATLFAASSYVPKDPAVWRDAKLFELSESAAVMAHDLSIRDWREWAPLARPPFPRMWVEWDPGPYLKTTAPEPKPGDIPAAKLGLFISYGDTYGEQVVGRTLEEQRALKDPNDPLQAVVRRTPILTLYAQHKRKINPTPWGVCISDEAWLKEEKDFEGKAELDPITRVAWGGPWYSKYGEPDGMTVVFREGYARLLYEAKVRGDLYDVLQIEDAVREFSGTVRVAMAVLALLNAERETLPIADDYRDGTTGHAVARRNVFRYTPRVITLEPDAPRYVSQRVAAMPSGIKKCHHDVRGHWRHYPARGGRPAYRKFIEAHERGDKSRGSTRGQKTYRVKQHQPRIYEDPK